MELRVALKGGAFGRFKVVFEIVCPNNEEVVKAARCYGGLFQFGVINGKECCLEVDNGSFRVTNGRCPQRQGASIYTDQETWMGMFRREEDVGTVAMWGKVKIGSSLFQAFKLKLIIDKVL